MQTQKSLIDEIKKSILLRKKFRIENKVPNFEILQKVFFFLFKKELSKKDFKAEFNYFFINKDGKKTSFKYLIKDLKDDSLLVTRTSKEGKYTTSLEIAKQKLIYQESVKLHKLPFGYVDSINKHFFKRNFRKRVKGIKQIIYGN